MLLAACALASAAGRAGVRRADVRASVVHGARLHYVLRAPGVAAEKIKQVEECGNNSRGTTVGLPVCDVTNFHHAGRAVLPHLSLRPAFRGRPFGMPAGTPVVGRQAHGRGRLRRRVSGVARRRGEAAEEGGRESSHKKVWSVGSVERRSLASGRSFVCCPRRL